ncbi:MAG: hypothetical protein KG003_14150 [Bacteroidetes bacterium]|nr:hypothetical protein [Bacteroidota bacterium]
MKKALALLLSVFLLTAQSGMAVTVHWCGKKIASVHFFSADKHVCACGKKKMKSNCCKDKTVIIKTQDIQTKAFKIAIKVESTDFNISAPTLLQYELSPSHCLRVDDFYHPPPYKPSVPIFLQDRVLII